ncbi:hypothetical protein ACFX2G_000450 [Malus domestica]
MLGIVDGIVGIEGIVVGNDGSGLAGSGGRAVGRVGNGLEGRGGKVALGSVGNEGNGGNVVLGCVGNEGNGGNVVLGRVGTEGNGGNVVFGRDGMVGTGSAGGGAAGVSKRWRAAWLIRTLESDSTATENRRKKILGKAMIELVTKVKL